MKTLKAILGAVALALISSNALAQTPAPAATATQGFFTPAPSPSPLLNKNIGTSSNWIKHLNVGECYVNPGSIAAGASTLMDCTVRGLLVGDIPFVNVGPPNSSTHERWRSDECFFVQGAKVTATDTLQVRLVNRETEGVLAQLACDPPAITIQYMVFRPNSQF